MGMGVKGQDGWNGWLAQEVQVHWPARCIAERITRSAALVPPSTIRCRTPQKPKTRLDFMTRLSGRYNFDRVEMHCDCDCVGMMIQRVRSAKTRLRQEARGATRAAAVARGSKGHGQVEGGLMLLGRADYHLRPI